MDLSDFKRDLDQLYNKDTIL